MSYSNGSRLKFSGWCYFLFHDDFMEWEDYDFIYETEQSPDDVDIDNDILDQFKKTGYHFEDNSKYYLYFEGDIYYWSEETLDGTEYDAEVNVNYFNIEKSTP